ncbi:MAG: hypothetical protein KUA35_06600 [Pseudodesulfovibrio sp.]|uniref:hypothetical protein n=1 Tax=Pseudodesulfovibrio TaxID=2035811 RepID=UPI00059ED029|nr:MULTISPECIES: hypothetical protein [Pseudodesulfovibrio]MBU4192861.1 hypothetical protein [Pseudomonadota bacterium]MBU4243176.1 hypothetical protein [Pseudomonadota bacterium]MBU4378378.1 hypothetical protein [Pseudomonadota bacterium]MBU4475631.1 hypothetical protein [Pseudomonadota bacterium]MBU4517665.1 hypothetical protein [Pseudomonadota bacterium]
MGDILNGIATLVVGFFALYLGYTQNRISKDKLKQDLFEKRFVVFKAAQELLSQAWRQGDLQESDVFLFRAERTQGIFLFDKDITDYLDEIGNKALTVCQCNTELCALSSGEKREVLLGKKMAELKWLFDQHPVLADRFSRYLKISEK